VGTSLAERLRLPAVQIIKIGNFEGAVSCAPIPNWTVSMAERTCLQEYHLAIQSFSDSLKGLNAVSEEVRVRCEKARRVWQEARTAYEREKSQATPSHSMGTCQERDALGEKYCTAVIAYNDALQDIQLPPRIMDGEKREKIERARNVCNSVFMRLEDHERKHKCRQAVRRSANAGSA
jgi:hypothetical protein